MHTTFKLSFAMLATVALSACGGGGGSASGSNTGAPTVGDFFSYQGNYTLQRVGGNPNTAPTGWSTEVTTSVNNNVILAYSNVSEDPSNLKSDSVNSTDGYFLSAHYGNCDETVSPGPYGRPPQLTLSSSWDNSNTKTTTCTGEDPRKVQRTSKGSVVGSESVTIQAGTFTAFKIQSVSTSTTTGTTGYNYTSTATRWVDSISGADLKSVTHGVMVYSNPDYAKYNYNSDSSLELIGYAHAASGRQKLNVERFGGPWQGTFSGTYNGTCSGEIWSDGTLDAFCGGFNVHGKIDANGKINFSQSDAGRPAFSSTSSTPLKLEGTWQDGSGGSGTWTMNHL
jgi:hypothetical protein